MHWLEWMAALLVLGCGGIEGSPIGTAGIATEAAADAEDGGQPATTVEPNEATSSDGTGTNKPMDGSEDDASASGPTSVASDGGSSSGSGGETTGADVSSGTDTGSTGAQTDSGGSESSGSDSGSSTGMGG